MSTPVEPGSPEWEQRLDALLLGESEGDLGWFWLSFADPNLPEGSQFLGVAIVQARGTATAVSEAHHRGINPGGEVATLGPLPPEHVPPEEYRNRLLLRADLERAGLV